MRTKQMTDMLAYSKLFCAAGFVFPANPEGGANYRTDIVAKPHKPVGLFRFAPHQVNNYLPQNGVNL